ncbi:MAG: immunity 53 family protein [Crocosphaera sp.]
MIQNNAFFWLQDWYTSQCNGEWEHTYGIDIKTLDNPGWLIIIDLVDTQFENHQFDEVSIKCSDNDWIHCFVKNGKFQAAGGSFNLLEILNIFRDWVEAKEYT